MNTTPDPAALQIREAVFPQDMQVVHALFRAYAESLGVDLAFQSFEEELAGLPGKYRAPEGAVLLAVRDGEVLGCVAMRPESPGICEMKRMYVLPAGRGLGLGRLLALAIIDRARAAGYVAMRLDTLRTLSAAVSLYRSLGFREIDPYIFNPLPEVMFFECAIDGADGGQGAR